MNKLILIIVLVVFLPFAVICQERWESTFGISNDDNYIFNKTIDYDGSILINWRIESNETSNISKIDKNGNELWRKTILNDQNAVYLNLLLSDSQQVIIGGGTEDFPFIMRLDKCYEISWCFKFINTQLFDHGHFVDAVILENEDILALAYIEPPNTNENKTDRLYLFYISNAGELIWYKLLASGEDYPNMEYPLPMYLHKFSNYYIVSGYCWYPFPDNPDLLGVRPMFIRIDNLFVEQWVLFYGLEDDFIGMGSAVIEDKYTSNNIGVGRYAGLSGVFSVTPFMMFDSTGNENGFNLLLNDSIGPDIKSNSSYDIISVEDNKYILSSSFGTESYGNPFGEILIDTSYKVISTLSHSDTDLNYTRIDTVENEQFVFGVNIYENPPSNNDRNILLYQLNSDLSQSNYDTTIQIYDSLCDFTIMSDTINLIDCDIITSLNEVYSDSLCYSSSLNSIKINVFPNPVSNSIVFNFKNTKDHLDIKLKCYNLIGEVVFEQNLNNGEDKIKGSVANWKNGIYIAVAISKQGTGILKFVVQH